MKNIYAGLTSLASKPVIRTIGLMSGTSMDGLDICVADIRLDKGENVAFDIIHDGHKPFTAELRNRVKKSLNGNTAHICSLNYDIGGWYAEAVEQELSDNGLNNIDLVGSHGQTIHHISGHSTLQIGEPSFLAKSLGVPVVSDFRAADIAAGGTGAPLIPRVDDWLFSSKEKARIALNIGGVANVTLLPPRGRGDVIGFDTGPGMALLDEYWQTKYSSGYDEDGKTASNGRINEKLVTDWLNDDFIPAPPPKSTGRDIYGITWLDKNVQSLQSMVFPGALATLAAFTADSIYTNCLTFLEEYSCDYLVAGGGGFHHRGIMERLAKRLTGIKIVSSSQFGVSPDIKEALGFAVLAVANIKGIAGNLPSVTGARYPAVLGKLSI